MTNIDAEKCKEFAKKICKELNIEWDDNNEHITINGKPIKNIKELFEKGE